MEGNTDMQDKLKVKKKNMHRQWNQGQVSVKSIGTLPGYVDGVRKAKAQVELNLARDTQNNKVYRYVN